MDVAELLLRFGADLNKVRSDGLTPLGVCVYKDNFALFKYVVENSIIPIREALFNALDRAVMTDKQHFIEYIKQYSEEHQLNLSVPMAEDVKKRFVKHKRCSAALISVGTSLSSFFFRSLHSDDRDDDNSALVITLGGSNVTKHANQ